MHTSLASLARYIASHGFSPLLFPGSVVFSVPVVLADGTLSEEIARVTSYEEARAALGY